MRGSARAGAGRGARRSSAWRANRNTVLQPLIHFAVAFGVLLHVAFWGAGLAMLAVPRPWRRFWPALIVPAGLALQSAVVWAGAHTRLHGAESYAGWSEAIPVLLLWLALRRHGARRALTDVN